MGAEMDSCDSTDDGRGFYIELKTCRDVDKVSASLHLIFLWLHNFSWFLVSHDTGIWQHVILNNAVGVSYWGKVWERKTTEVLGKAHPILCYVFVCFHLKYFLLHHFQFCASWGRCLFVLLVLRIDLCILEKTYFYLRVSSSFGVFDMILWWDRCYTKHNALFENYHLIGFILWQDLYSSLLQIQSFWQDFHTLS